MEKIKNTIKGEGGGYLLMDNQKRWFPNIDVWNNLILANVIDQ